MKQVHVSETATDRVPNSSPTGASISTDLYGMAALDACEQITERLRPVAAKLPAGAPFATVVKVRQITANVSASCFEFHMYVYVIVYVIVRIVKYRGVHTRVVLSNFCSIYYQYNKHTTSCLIKKQKL